MISVRSDGRAFFLGMMVFLAACGRAEAPVSEPEPEPAAPAETVRESAPVAELPDPGPPVDIGIYVPDREELDRRIREAREAAEARERPSLPAVTSSAVVESPAPVLPPPVVSLPDRGPVQPQRPLHPRLAALLRHLEANDLKAAHNGLKDIKADTLVPQDRFLLQGLQSYIYFRLGEDVTALGLIDKMGRELADTMPLKIKALQLVEGPLRDIRFGRYRPAVKPVHKPGGTFYLYLEPENVVQVFQEEVWRVSLEVDFTLRDSRGNVVDRMEHISGKAFEQMCNDVLVRDVNRNRRLDLYYAFHVPVPPGLNPMDYTLEVVLKDCNTQPRKEAKASLTLTVE